MHPEDGNKKAAPEGAAKFGGETSHNAEKTHTLFSGYGTPFRPFKVSARPASRMSLLSCTGQFRGGSGVKARPVRPPEPAHTATNSPAKGHCEPRAYADAATIESPTICTIRSNVASGVISGGARHSESPLAGGPSAPPR